MLIEKKDNKVTVSDYGGMNLDLTLDCGQAFRWKKAENGVWHGVAYGKSIGIESDGSTLTFYGSSVEDVENIWVDYFDLKRDYGKILASFENDTHVASAIKKYGTVRILNQEPWEALCSFIISACNNIPRIKGIVERMCESFGERLPDGSYAFPTPDKTATLTEEDMSVLRAGYRVPYLMDAAARVSMGTTDFGKIRGLDENAARKELMNIKGVGKKVADCTLLFALGFSGVFPVDRHIMRACAELYPEGLPECFAPFPGLAQQYIFNQQRTGNN